ncbi:MAG TPA: sugar phosphate nucleotidyltransferase [candidate division Zixibacteria bacterium]|nr:sugar phosphate nucleotidyltransferase [candidate division Zixibacteria bacterium]
MKDTPVVILCGGKGTRMRGQTETKKELVRVGGKPILWHVMRIFSSFGHSRFILTLGYEAEQIKRYFMEYETLSRDIELDSVNQDGESNITFLEKINHPPWQVAMVDTGLHTMKASRISHVRQYLTTDRFFVAYGDDVSDVDLNALASFHRRHGKLATLTAVQVNLQYGVIEADEEGQVHGFVERPRLSQWINGGFFLFEKAVLDLIPPDKDVSLEKDVLTQLADSGELMAYRHDGFWQSMNTMKDNLLLEELWQQGAPWKVW